MLIKSHGVFLGRIFKFRGSICPLVLKGEEKAHLAYLHVQRGTRVTAFPHGSGFSSLFTRRQNIGIISRGGGLTKTHVAVGKGSVLNLSAPHNALSCLCLRAPFYLPAGPLVNCAAPRSHAYYRRNTTSRPPDALTLV